MQKNNEILVLINKAINKLDGKDIKEIALGGLGLASIFVLVNSKCTVKIKKGDFDVTIESDDKAA